MRILGLDVSTKTGWAVLEDGKYVEHGQFKVVVEDFNVNDYPDRSPKYPSNMIKAADEMGKMVLQLVREKKADIVVIENTVKGRNRHTQRILEWIHKAIMDDFVAENVKFVYRDPSAWRNVLEMRLTNEDKLNNKLVKQGKKRGKVGKKHLSVRLANELFGLKLILKNNDISDALLLAAALNVELVRGTK